MYADFRVQLETIGWIIDLIDVKLQKEITPNIVQSDVRKFRRELQHKLDTTCGKQPDAK